MAKYKAKTKGCQLIVKAKLSNGEKIENHEFDCFSRKYIRGLLKARLVKKNTIEYVGPVGITLYERLKKPFSKYDFLFMMEQVVDVIQKINVNGLLANKVVFDIKNVYVNEITKEIQFIFLPLEQQETEANLMKFIENIIYSTKPMEEEDTNYISRFVYFVKELQKFDADKIEKYIFKEDRNVVNTIKKHNIGQSGYMTDKQADYYAHYENDDAATELLQDDEATGLLYDDEATGLLSDNEATGLLNDDEATGLLREDMKQVHYATLYRHLTDENIPINKPVFRIGKERSYSDYFVNNNDKISRSHADIITRGQRIFIIDLNSKNHTYVNEEQIPVQEEVEIFDGNLLRLANEEFEIHI